MVHINVGTKEYEVATCIKYIIHTCLALVLLLPHMCVLHIIIRMEYGACKYVTRNAGICKLHGISIKNCNSCIQYMKIRSKLAASATRNGFIFMTSIPVFHSLQYSRSQSKYCAKYGYMLLCAKIFLRFDSHAEYTYDHRMFNGTYYKPTYSKFLSSLLTLTLTQWARLIENFITASKNTIIVVRVLREYGTDWSAKEILWIIK